MLKTGQNNTLEVNRLVDFGAYLDAGDGAEILLPAKYFPHQLKPGDEVDVFVYTDSEDRLIATTETPKARVGEFAYLTVAQVNRTGAFLDWGITAKDLLVPYSEQKADMREGGTYLVYVYLDNTTGRIVGSSKIEKYIGNVIPHYKKGEEVEALVIERTPIGYRCIVDNRHYGMLYDNEVYRPLKIGDRVTAHIKNIRDDFKLDLSAGARADRRTSDLGTTILNALSDAGGRLPISDKSDPDTIQRHFACSKRDFKKAIGHLYKDHKITISADCIRLCADKEREPKKSRIK